jgi:hypothetical protein
MPDSLIISLGAALALVGLLIAVYWVVKMATTVQIRNLAERLLPELKRVLLQSGRFEKVDEADYPALDHGFYRERTDFLHGLGFLTLGDITLSHLEELRPPVHTFMRILTGNSDTVLATIYHVQVNQDDAPGVDPAELDQKATDFETELEDGRFVLTTSFSPKYSFVEHEKMLTEHHPQGTSVRALLQRHMARLQNLTRENPRLSAKRISRLHEVEDAQERLMDLKREAWDRLDEKAFQGILLTMFHGRHRTLARRLAKQLHILKSLGRLRG